jgi:hypothetical protein
MKKNLLIAIPLASAVLFSGCATIFSGKTQQINVNTNPTHKEVQIGAQTVVTPSIVRIKRSGDSLMVKSQNCQEQKILPAKINPVFFANVFFVYYMFSASTTDYVTDAMWKYDDNVNLNCQK